MEDESVGNLLNVARKYFPFVSIDSFPHLFKLSAKIVSNHLGSITDGRFVRNFLILLYWCRHYPPFTTLGALFGLSDTQVCDIVHELVDQYARHYEKYINLNRLDILDDFFLPGVCGIFFVL